MATNTVLAAGQASKLIRREEVAEGTIAFHFEKPIWIQLQSRAVRRCDTRRPTGN